MAPARNPAEARVTTNEKRRTIGKFEWAKNNTHILYAQDNSGREDWHIFALELATGNTYDLTPFDGVSARILGTSLDHPEIVALGVNDRTSSSHDVWIVDLRTYQRTLLFENRKNFAGIVLDAQCTPRVAIEVQAGGSWIVHRIAEGIIRPFRLIENYDVPLTRPICFSRDGNVLYWLSSQNRDKLALTAMDWATATEAVLVEHPRADITEVLVNPSSNVPEASVATYIQSEWIIIDQKLGPDFRFLQRTIGADFGIHSRSTDNSLWIVSDNRSTKPRAYKLYDRAHSTLTDLMDTRPSLRGYPLSAMNCEIINSRDGLELVTYISLPSEEPARPRQPLPMVLLVHGGPWDRDTYGFSPWHQWLTNRGYAVLSVNFRGSTGFGKSFLNAGNLEWGGKMQDDLLDAAAWAIEQDIARKDRIAIVGGSYGGYAALAALAFSPEAFCCGVDIVGVSNLETFLRSISPQFASSYEMLASRIGDPRTETGRQLLWRRSPVNFAANIRRPLLIAHGANDPRVKLSESQQIVSAMMRAAVPVTYVLFPEEGHSFSVPDNRLFFYALIEAFLGIHLGGRVEPMPEQLGAAKFLVPEGLKNIPELAAFCNKLAG